MKKITVKTCITCKKRFGLSSFDGNASKKCRECKRQADKKSAARGPLGKPKDYPVRSPKQLKRIAGYCFNKYFDKVPSEFHELIYENEGLWAEMGGR